MWHDMAMNLIMFSHDSHSHRTHEYVESHVHLKNQVTLNLNVIQIENKFNKIIKLFCLYFLMYLLDVLDSWIFEVVLHKLINEI